MKPFKSLVVIYILSVLFFCIDSAMLSAEEEQRLHGTPWQASFIGGIGFGDNDFLPIYDLGDKAFPEQHLSDIAQGYSLTFSDIFDQRTTSLTCLFGTFRLDVRIDGRQSQDGEHWYFTGITLDVTPGHFYKAVATTGQSAMGWQTDAQTRVQITKISFLEMNPDTNRLAGSHNITSPLLDTAVSARQSYDLGDGICVPHNVPLIVTYKIGTAGGGDLYVPAPVCYMRIPPIVWRVPVEGVDANIPAAEEGKITIFGYVYDGENGWPLQGIPVFARKDRGTATEHRASSNTDENGYFVCSFTDTQGVYLVGVGGGIENAEIVHDASNAHYYGAKRMLHDVIPGTCTPVIFNLEQKRPPVSIIRSIEPAVATDGQDVQFVGSCHTRSPAQRIRQLHWFSSRVNTELSQSISFSKNDLPLGENTIQFWCADEDGDRSFTAEASLRINQRPYVQIATFQPDSAFIGEPVHFHLIGDDMDGDGIRQFRCLVKRGGEAAYSVLQEGSPTRVEPPGGGRQCERAHFEFDHTFDRDGEYEIVGTACDNLGGWASDPNSGETRDDHLRPIYRPFQGDVKRLTVNRPPENKDLVITEVTFLDETTYIDEPTRISVDIANRGNARISADHVKLGVGSGQDRRDVNIGQTQRLVLDPGQVINVTTDWTPRQAGTQRLQLMVDSTNVVNEFNRENNNTMTVERLVVGHPDLTIEEMWVDPATPRVGATATINARIRNISQWSAVGYYPKVRFTVGSEYFYYPPYPTANLNPQSAPIIAPNQRLVATASWTPRFSGENVMIRGEIDPPPGELRETNELNNSMEIRLNVLPVEEAAEAPPQAQAQASGADLELMPGTLEFSAPAFRVGKDIKIAVKVKNTGTKKLTPVEVAFWADEAMIGEATVKGLAPGEKEMLVIKWTPEMSGTYTIYAIADPNKRFHEIDEGNNRDSRQITISD